MIGARYLPWCREKSREEKNFGMVGLVQNRWARGRFPPPSTPALRRGRWGRGTTRSERPKWWKGKVGVLRAWLSPSTAARALNALSLPTRFNRVVERGALAVPLPHRCATGEENFSVPLRELFRRRKTGRDGTVTLGHHDPSR